MKKTGWNPKKGLLQPKSSLSPEGSANPQAPEMQIKEAPADCDQAIAAPVQHAEAAHAPVPAVPKLEERSSLAKAGKTSSLSQANLDPSKPRIYVRAGWKTVLHWMAFAFAMMFDIEVIRHFIVHNLIATKALTLVVFKKQLILYSFAIFLNVMVLPSIIMEAQKIEVYADRLVIRNLLTKSVLTWAEIKAIFAPMFLKFAIIQTAKFFQLINKRDIKGCDELLHTIKVKAGLEAN